MTHLLSSLNGDSIVHCRQHSTSHEMVLQTSSTARTSRMQTKNLPQHWQAEVLWRTNGGIHLHQHSPQAGHIHSAVQLSQPIPPGWAQDAKAQGCRARVWTPGRKPDSSNAEAAHHPGNDAGKAAEDGASVGCSQLRTPVPPAGPPGLGTCLAAAMLAKLASRMLILGHSSLAGECRAPMHSSPLGSLSHARGLRSPLLACHRLGSTCVA